VGRTETAGHGSEHLAPRLGRRCIELAPVSPALAPRGSGTVASCAAGPKTPSSAKPDPRTGCLRREPALDSAPFASEDSHGTSRARRVAGPRSRADGVWGFQLIRFLRFLRCDERQTAARRRDPQGHVARILEGRREGRSRRRRRLAGSRDRVEGAARRRRCRRADRDRRVVPRRRLRRHLPRTARRTSTRAAGEDRHRAERAGRDLRFRARVVGHRHHELRRDRQRPRRTHRGPVPRGALGGQGQGRAAALRSRDRRAPSSAKRASWKRSRVIPASSCCRATAMAAPTRARRSKSARISRRRTASRSTACSARTSLAPPGC
jgi:hypothetical protein